VYQYLNRLNRLHGLVSVSSCRDVEVVSVDPNLLLVQEMKQLHINKDSASLGGRERKREDCD